MLATIGADNPYTSRLAEELGALGAEVYGLGLRTWFLGRLFKRGLPAVLHLHWLHVMVIGKTPLMSVIKRWVFLVQLRLVKLMGVRVVWTAHNLKAHEERFADLDRAGHAAVLSVCDGVIAHCEEAKRLLLERFPRVEAARIEIVPHGNYDGAYGPGPGRDEARRRLGLPRDALVFLLLGQLRPYKGVTDLIEAFRSLDAPDAWLVVAGRLVGEGARETIGDAIGPDNRVVFHPGFVEDDDVSAYFEAADVCVFPYRDVLTSGAAVLAMTHAKACVGPRIGCLKDVLTREGAYSYDPDDDDGLPDALSAAAADRAEHRERGESNRRLADEWCWSTVARSTAGRVYGWDVGP